MKRQTLRDRSMKIGLCAVILGAIAAVSGVCLANPTVIGIGCVALFAGMYALIFARVGSF